MQCLQEQNDEETFTLKWTLKRDFMRFFIKHHEFIFEFQIFMLKKDQNLL